ncbi:hypothetical protein COLO4_19880 [Corchorus olitorius]|uniref:BZIP domain-containing protein n=1 Tax=Corchorus olitorius TaxID=93759 RepID=A0A1R3J2W0_9ROSI|nr:hypothetical protein COLO4_19880 [Corchorus olitorius]
MPSDREASAARKPRRQQNPSPTSSATIQESHVIGDVEAGSSSGQTRMITSGGSLMNPLGFPYRSEKKQQVAHSPPPPSESGIQSSPDELLTPSVIPVNKRGKKATHGAIAAGEKKKLTMLKNRISAARSRARRREDAASREIIRLPEEGEETEGRRQTDV